jgi:hypothetical protein
MWRGRAARRANDLMSTSASDCRRQIQNFPDQHTRDTIATYIRASPFPQENRLKMVSNRLSKVTKQITKKKGKNPNLHEGSRDTQRLQAAAARDDKLNRLTNLREKQNRHYCMQVPF